MQEGLVNPLFQPDSVAPAQFEETMHRAVPLEPEKRLMIAVLEDAVMCFQDNLFTRDKKKKQLFVETEEWLFEERSDRLFSFESLCRSLDLDPYYVRQGLRAWQESRSKKQIKLPSNYQSAVRHVAKAANKNPKRKSRLAVGRNVAPPTLSRFR
jgi:hypothetical protein